VGKARCASPVAQRVDGCGSGLIGRSNRLFQGARKVRAVRGPGAGGVMARRAVRRDLVAGVGCGGVRDETSFVRVGEGAISTCFALMILARGKSRPLKVALRLGSGVSSTV
jgi:hypothetical protein